LDLHRDKQSHHQELNPLLNLLEEIDYQCHLINVVVVFHEKDNIYSGCYCYLIALVGIANSKKNRIIAVVVVVVEQLLFLERQSTLDVILGWRNYHCYCYYYADAIIFWN